MLIRRNAAWQIHASTCSAHGDLGSRWSPPEEYLDERQAALRDAAYVRAHRLLGGFVGLLASVALVAFVVLGQDADTWSVSITWNVAMAAFWVALGLVLALPSLVLALDPRV